MLGIDAEIFGAASISQSWRESDDVMIYPSCDAVRKFEGLYKWIIRGSPSKVENKMKDVLKIAKIDRQVRGDYCTKISGEDVYVALSYIVYLYLGSLSEKWFRRE